MSECIITTIRSSPRTKIDLIYDESGWKVDGQTAEVFKACYIIRSWISKPGEGQASVKEVKLLPDEFKILQGASL